MTDGWIGFLKVCVKRFLGKILEYGISSNTVYGFAAKGVAMVFFFAMDITLARLLPVSGYGEWSYFFSIISICFWFCWMGINSSTCVHVAIEAEKKENLLTCIKSSISLRIIVSTAFAVVFYFASPLLLSFLDHTDNYPNLNLLLRFGAVLLLLNSISELLKNLWIGLQKQKYLFWQTQVEYGFLFIVVVGLVLIYRSSVFVIVSYIVSLSSSLVVAFLILYYFIKKNNISSSRNNSQGYWKRILKFAMPLWLAGLAHVILMEIGTVMIGYLSSSEEVAIFNVAKKLSDKALHLNLAYMHSIMPAFAVLSYENIKEKSGYFKKALKMNALLVLIASIILSVGGTLLIPLLYGYQYSDSVLILYLLIPQYICQAFISFLMLFTGYQKKMMVRNIAYLLAIAVCFVLNYLLIPSYGAMGAAVAMSISAIPLLATLIIVSYRLIISYQSKEVLYIK